MRTLLEHPASALVDLLGYQNDGVPKVVELVRLYSSVGTHFGSCQ